MNRLILMLQFFTRLPINKTVPVEREDFKYGSIYMPVVGLVIGLINVLFYTAAYFTNNIFLTSVVTVMSWAAVTGALHLDGLSDTCDGIYSSRSKDKMLEIMKDSRIGTMGALALMFAVLLKISIIWGFSFKAAQYSIAIAPIAARTSLILGIAISKYPREKGLGKSFIGNVTVKEFLIGLLICAVIVAPILKVYFLALLAVIVIIPLIFNKYIESKIGGMTGDTLGALCEIQEILCLILFYALSGFIWK